MTPSAQFFNNSQYIQKCSQPMKLFAFTNGCITSMFETCDTDIYDVLLKAKCDIETYCCLLKYNSSFTSMNSTETLEAFEKLKLHKGAINSLAKYFGFRFNFN